MSQKCMAIGQVLLVPRPVVWSCLLCCQEQDCSQSYTLQKCSTRRVMKC